MPDRDQTDNAFRRTAETARNKMADAGSKLADAVEGDDAVVGFCHDVEKFVSAKPLKALAFAFVAGAVVARLIL